MNLYLDEIRIDDQYLCSHYSLPRHLVLVLVVKLLFGSIPVSTLYWYKYEYHPRNKIFQHKLFYSSNSVPGT